jgi:hypothetical protein
MDKKDSDNNKKPPLEERLRNIFDSGIKDEEKLKEKLRDEISYKEAVELVTKFALKDLVLPGIISLVGLLVIGIILLNKIHVVLPILLVLLIIVVTSILSLTLAKSGKVVLAIVSFGIHVILLIFGFGVTYHRSKGIMHSGGDFEVKDLDYYYFSIVTWTTLGYGDFKPSESLRFVAALEAFMGFIYMGLFLALVWKFIEPKESSQTAI